MDSLLRGLDLNNVMMDKRPRNNPEALQLNSGRIISFRITFTKITAHFYIDKLAKFKNF